jgi:hypothetical protein
LIRRLKAQPMLSAHHPDSSCCATALGLAAREFQGLVSTGSGGTCSGRAAEKWGSDVAPGSAISLVGRPPRSGGTGRGRSGLGPGPMAGAVLAPGWKGPLCPVNPSQVRNSGSGNGGMNGHDFIDNSVLTPARFPRALLRHTSNVHNILRRASKMHTSDRRRQAA